MIVRRSARIAQRVIGLRHFSVSIARPEIRDVSELPDRLGYLDTPKPRYKG